ncbi:Protein of unknown function (DUF2997) [Actinoplanes lutulentus]|uniref:DUF2997 family protein n=1 Tax=Actinoplanes lutulentus TaxID=1287878 RepID=A0A327Z2Y3_9ACTN|nr:DUF2997 domain-containing protein [Actinoplanes lutulentus]RAK28363.1 Protein of unknown function (DUF2997) [Actinoplanes lutulentus]
MIRRIVVNVRPDGTVSAETQGITGVDCLEYIEMLEKLLLAKTVESHYTSDFHQTEESDYHSQTAQGIEGV